MARTCEEKEALLRDSEREKRSFEKRIKDMEEGFIDIVNSANTEEIKKYILESEQHIYDIEES